MKIIQIMPEFGLAGAETMCENLSYELVKMHFDVIIISLYDYHSAITERIESAGIKIIYLNKKPGMDISIFKKIYRILKKEKPDVIHTHRYIMRYVMPGAILTKVPRHVHTVHNIANKEVNKSSQLFARLFFKHFHSIPVALSDKIQDSIAETYNMDKKNIPVIPNGIDLGKCIVKQDYSFSREIRILHIGRFAEQKNHVGLIQAFEIIHSRFNETKLLLIGEGEKEKEIQELVKNFGLNDSVEFLGKQNNVYNFLTSADIFLLPSKYEGLPMTLLEAMGSGLPIVATNVGGIPDILENQYNAILTECNPIKIANGVCDIIADQKLRMRIGKNALLSSEKYSSFNMCKNYVKLYRGEDYNG